jgi:hypothetical protein
MSVDRRSKTAEIVLREAAQAVVPLVCLLVRHGVDHPRFAAVLKRLFVEAAIEDLRAAGDGAPTLTAIGLRSGLQRRDVRTQLAHLDAPLPPKALTPTLPMQALARWVSDPAYNDAEGNPLVLPLRASDAAAPTFERLAEALSKDVHAPALLDELVRLGLVRFEDGLARVLIEGFVPSRGSEQLLGAMARNLGDHARAAVANVLAGETRFLEYSLIADELRPDSAEALHRLARKLWRSAYKRALNEATEHIERDKALGFDDSAPETRVRFGVYFYSEPVVAASSPASPASASNAPGSQEQ